ncbi:MAG: iron-sulfur protein [Chloroflexi bacterium]|nr:iron-sulfur protein [Chloroflexota bacterium]
MKIAVLSGSPKGDLSVTLQYVRFIQKKLPQHQLKVHHVSHDIQKLEKDGQAFANVIKDIEASDGVLWAFPLYVFLVPSQYKRFIELIWERGAQGAFKNKYTAVLSTSIHFFDHTAHNYMRAICDDLDMKFVDSFSADMDDLFLDEMRNRLLIFAQGLFEAIEKKLPTSKAYSPLTYSKFRYAPGKAKDKVDTRGMKVLVLTDSQDKDSNLARMVKRFQESFAQPIEVVNLYDINIRGGCLGCVQCGFDNICVYEGKDGYIDFFNNKVRHADITIYASTIKDRFMSARMKMSWDRGFFNGHVPAHMGKQMGFIVSGPLSQIPNLRQIMDAWAEMSLGNLAGVVSDECQESAQLDALLQNMATRCIEYSTQVYIRPKTFLGVGGYKLFRDAIWARLRFPFTADYRFYRKHNLFDFPQKDKRYGAFNKQMISMIKNPEMKEMVRKMIKTEMVKGYQKVVDTK